MLRHCISLGIHLKIKSGSTTKQHEEKRRAELWYSLIRFETLLSELTGRPKSIDLDEITVALDSNEHAHQEDDDGEAFTSRVCWERFSQLVDTAVSNAQTTDYCQILSSMTFPYSVLGKSSFTAILKLCRISDLIRKQYHGVENVPWHDFHNSTKRLHHMLVIWQTNLPTGLQFRAEDPDIPDSPAKLPLFVYWASLHMVLCRPYVCATNIPEESEESRQFDQDTARTGVEAALSVIQVLCVRARSALITVKIHDFFALHFISQALGILLLETTLDHRHCYPQNFQRIMDAIKEALAYLWPLCHHSKSAFKLWTLSNLVLKTALQKYQAVDLIDTSATAPKPLQWTSQDQDAFNVDLRSLSLTKPE